MSDCKKLMVWEKAHRLTLDIYQMTATFPKEKLYGLTSQVKRAAASVPANIAEGSGRGSNPELFRFLRIATGSAYELEYHILLAHDLNLLTEENYERLNSQVMEVKRMLTGLIQHLETKRR
ncbi:MAG: four helix bundle protein [Anaerolineae bacterium]|nr:four helix bundle protein [Anaerolineae bacterium]